MFNSISHKASAFFKRFASGPAPENKTKVPILLPSHFSNLPPHLQETILGDADAFLPRTTLVQDIVNESERPVLPTKTFDSLQAARINLLTRYSLNRNNENNDFLKQSIIENNLPLFDALMKTTDNPDLPSLLELAATEQNDEAFRKLVCKIRNQLPQRTLQHVAEYGQVDNLRQLLETSNLAETEKKELLTLAKKRCRDEALSMVLALGDNEFDFI